MHLIILSSFPFVHFVQITCIEGLMVTVYIYYVVSFTVHLKHYCWKHWHDTAVDGLCHHLQGRPLEQIKFMDNALAEVLSPNHVDAPVPMCRSREAQWRQASMLVFVIGKDPKILNKSLQSCLHMANTWMSNNGIKLNASKPKCTLIRSPRSRIHLPSLDIQLCGCRIEQGNYLLQVSGINCQWYTVSVKPRHPHH